MAPGFSGVLIRTGQIDDSQLPYMMLDSLIAAYYPDLADTKIIIGFSYGLKPDSNTGKIKLGDIKACDKFERQLHDKDVKLYLNYDFWHHSSTRDEQRKALIDRYIWRIQVKMDKELDVPLRDEHGRMLYYLREYDIQDSQEVVQRHGIWNHDMESAVKVMAEVWEKEQKKRQEAVEGDESDEPDSVMAMTE
jgi:hypothetical protein